MVENIGKVPGAVLPWVCAIEEHLGLCDPAAAQRRQNIIPGTAPGADGTHEVQFLVSGQVAAAQVVLNPPDNPVLGLHPGGAYVVGEAHQGIKLILRKRKPPADSEVVHRRGIILLDLFPQQRVCLSPGNPVGINGIGLGLGPDHLAVLVLHSAAIANGVLTVVPIGRCRKALFLFDHIDQLFTDLKLLHLGISSRGMGRRQRQASDKENSHQNCR